MRPHRCPSEDALHADPRPFEVQLHLERCAACRSILAAPASSGGGAGWLVGRLPALEPGLRRAVAPKRSRGAVWTLRRPGDAHWAEPDFFVLVIEAAKDEGAEVVRIQALVDEYSPGVVVLDDLAGYAAVPGARAWTSASNLAHYVALAGPGTLSACAAAGEPSDAVHASGAAPGDRAEDGWSTVDALRLAFSRRVAALDPVDVEAALAEALSTRSAEAIDRAASRSGLLVEKRLAASPGQSVLEIQDGGGQPRARVFPQQEWKVVPLPERVYDNRVGRIVDSKGKLRGCAWAFDDTTLVTAAHVLEGSSARLATPAGAVLCDCVGVWPDEDIAVLRFPGIHDLGVWPSRMEPSVGPHSILFADDEWGIVATSAQESVAVCAGTFTLSGIRPGMSGAPIVDGYGDGVGVVVECDPPRGRDLRVLAPRMAGRLVLMRDRPIGAHVFASSSVEPACGRIGIICAPPGFGKTTLLDELEARHSGKVLRVDANPLGTLAELDAALARRASYFGTRIEQLDDGWLVLIDDLHAIGRMGQDRFARTHKNELIRRTRVVVATRIPDFCVRGAAGSRAPTDYFTRDHARPLPAPPTRENMVHFVEQLPEELQRALIDALDGKTSKTLISLNVVDESGRLTLDEPWKQQLAHALRP